jgi:hypothetical protein
MDAIGWLPVLFIGFFVLVIGAILFQIVRGIGQWAYNNGQPVLSEPARVVSKRTETRGSVGSNTGGSVNTWYHVTFELESGERRELGVNGREYGKLAEGDEGTLTLQGTRYKGFARQPQAARQRAAA